MIYSVYDHSARRWDYYEGVGSVPTTAFFRDNRAGFGLERLGARVPPGAVAVGSGELPRGVVATMDESPGGLAGLGQVDPPTTASGVLSWLGLLVVLGGAVWIGRKSVGWESSARSKAGALKRALS